MVADGEDRAIAVSHYPHLHRRPRRGVGQGVADQVVHELLEPGRVAEHRDGTGGLQLEPAGAVDHAGVVDHGGHQRGQVHRHQFDIGTLALAGQDRQVADQHAHAGGLLLDPVERPVPGGPLGQRVLAEQLGVALDRGERRAQLVGGVGQEAAQPFLGSGTLGERRLDLGEHAVERPPEPRDLRGAVARLDPPGEVARGDGVRLARHVLERAQPAPDHDGDHHHQQDEQTHGQGDQDRPQ